MKRRHDLSVFHLQEDLGQSGDPRTEDPHTELVVRRGLERRLDHIRCPTLLLWGESDRVVPRSYADKFANGIRGDSKIEIIADAGHLAELDRPAEVAAAIRAFVA